MATLSPMKTVLESLTKARIQFEVFDRVSVEPTDASLQVAIEYSRSKQFSTFVAVGGGSVIDTGTALQQPYPAIHPSRAPRIDLTYLSIHLYAYIHTYRSW